MTSDTTAVPTGNTYDKYGTTNPVERAMMRRFFTALDDLVGSAAPSRILEVGVGEGHVSGRIIDRFPGVPFVGVDLPDPDLADGWRRVGLDASFADITRLPFADDSFDLVLAVEVLEHVPDPEGALRELSRVGRDRLVVSVPREPIWRLGNLARLKYVSDLGNTPGHIQHWSARGFTDLVGRYARVDQRRSPVPWTVVSASLTGPR